MKFFAATFLVNVLTLSFAVASPYLDQATDGESPVRLQVKCDGVDFTKLSLPDSTIVGNVLRDAYNTVHTINSNDDSELKSLTYRGAVLGDVEDEGSLGRKFRRTKMGSWTGTWNCEVCPTFDDPTGVLLASGGSTHKAWQNSFVAGLLESGKDSFKKISKCNIDMSPGTADIIGGNPNVDIDLWCGNKINLKALSVPQGTFLAHALESSYNKVHANAADDDSTLGKVFYHASPKKSMLEDSLGYRNAPWENPRWNNQWNNNRYNTGRLSPGLSGDWGCRGCRPADDDAMLGSSGVALNAWEAEFLVILQEGPFAIFDKIDKCDIKLLPRKLTGAAADDPAVPCGIRGGCDGVSAD